MTTPTPTSPKPMDRDEILALLADAREKGVRADLSGKNLRWADLRSADLRWADLRSADLRSADLGSADLRSADLRWADLRWADLSSADLRWADLRWADLRSADLRSADLSSADLRSANLRSANLRWADLGSADLRSANLRSANLRWADLRWANLSSANLSSARGGVLAISGLPSGPLTYQPTPDGWLLRIGCWKGTTDQLRELVATDEGWPEAEGEQCAQRRPGLLAAATLCDAHAAAHTKELAAVIAKWGKPAEVAESAAATQGGDQ